MRMMLVIPAMRAMQLTAAPAARMHLRDIPGSDTAHNSGRKRGDRVACEAPEMAASIRLEIATANIIRSILSSLDGAHETTRARDELLRIVAAAGVTLLVVVLAVLFFKWVFS